MGTEELWGSSLPVSAIKTWAPKKAAEHQSYLPLNARQLLLIEGVAASQL